jgi:hypothetical protein
MYDTYHYIIVRDTTIFPPKMSGSIMSWLFAPTNASSPYRIEDSKQIWTICKPVGCSHAQRRDGTGLRVYRASGDQGSPLPSQGLMVTTRMYMSEGSVTR